ncbi:DUF445 domain-containing protein [Desulfitibacter alkalitolerans]|uniref:DUF445 domain-containing protein n=1 Tax=Desulfitibacter alkalitolerans TaxID=264641 RepID=UPI0004813965|nr:DUF445 family protein [Desulfitibacter alkalitolerans]
MELKLIIIPVMGAIIGWVTNLIAIKLIFRPYKPMRFPIINFSIQGIIPKRRYEIAANIGKIVEKELLCIKDLIPAFESGINDTVFIKNIASIIKSNLTNRIPGIFPSRLKETVGNMIEEILIKELTKVLPTIARQGLEDLSDNIVVHSIVEEKINNLELAEFEKLIISITRRELKHIEYLGAVLGFIIGLGQLLIITVLA